MKEKFEMILGDEYVVQIPTAESKHPVRLQTHKNGAIHILSINVLAYFHYAGYLFYLHRPIETFGNKLSGNEVTKYDYKTFNVTEYHTGQAVSTHEKTELKAVNLFRERMTTLFEVFIQKYDVADKIIPIEDLNLMI